MNFAGAALHATRAGLVRETVRNLTKAYAAYKAVEPIGKVAKAVVLDAKDIVKDMYGKKRKRSSSFGKSRKKYKKRKIVKRANPAKGVLTNQRDVRVKTYGRKRISKRQKNRKVFQMKVKKAMMYNGLTHTLLVQAASGNITYPVTAGTQVVINSDGTVNRNFRLGVYPNGVSSEMDRLIAQFRGLGVPANGLRDAFGIDTVTGAAVVTRPAQNDLFKTNEFIMTSCFMDLTLRNPQTGAAQAIIVDIYECVNMGENETVHTTALQSWSDCLTQSAQGTANPAGTWVAAGTTTGGATPFHATQFGLYWKVLKHTSIELSPGKQASYQMKGFRGKFTEQDLGTGSVIKYKRGWVKDLIVIANPTFSGGGTSPTVMMEYEWQKTYYFKMPHYTGDKPVNGVYFV